MSVLEQYRYEGGIRPDFQALPTQVAPEEFMPEKAEASEEKLTEAEVVEEKSADADAEAAEEKSADAEEKSADAEEKPADAEAAEEKPADAEAAEEKPADAEAAAGKPAKAQEDPVRVFLKEKTAANLVEIERLQKALRSAKKSALIIIIHGMPYSGRTETSHFLKKGMNKGVKEYSYKKGDRSHDFLWQMHRRTPKYGKICIMNNSIYADVPGEKGGTEKVRAFEKYLRESGVAVVRIFLNVSSKKQKNRMLEVLTTKPGAAPRAVPKDKGWRKAFLEEFADVVEAATPETPWYIIPADNKWYARCLVTEIVRDALRECVREGSASEAEKAEAAVENEAEIKEEVKPAEKAEAKPEEKAAETTEEKPAEPAPEPVKKPARRTRRKKEEAPAEEVKAETETEAKAEVKTETKAAEAAPAKKTTTRRPRRQGPPKTVEETLARRRKRMEDSEG